MSAVDPSEFNVTNVVRLSQALAREDANDIISGVYYANRLLANRKTNPRASTLGRKRRSRIFSKTDQRIASRVVQSIEKIEKTPLRFLGEKRVRKYADALYGVIQRRVHGA